MGSLHLETSLLVQLSHPIQSPHPRSHLSPRSWSQGAHHCLSMSCRALSLLKGSHVLPPHGSPWWAGRGRTDAVSARHSSKPLLLPAHPRQSLWHKYIFTNTETQICPCSRLIFHVKKKQTINPETLWLLKCHF